MKMIMEVLSADEKITYYYWHILNKIKEAAELQNNENAPITYALFLHPALNDPYKPNSVVEQELIQKMIDEGILEETEERSNFKVGEDVVGNPKAAGVHYYFKVDTVRFNDLYDKYKRLIQQHQLAEEKGNTLIFNTANGEVSYTSPDGKTYEGELNKNTNSYRILSFLVDQPINKLFDFSELAKHLNSPRGHSREPTEERRVRDTIQSIKEVLNYYGEDLFISDYGFGIKCKVHIIR